ncbi:hypothetical protein RBU61_11355 [Tissierella sp. MB52-C2]|uniref:hypothetical protein n=1 Tax=Tissierella sp. MB52-C2 TaxID=3070999 RepID=UPI00280C12C5|nr:hypothetical protein [Tissierella sp. MB52-C2]WMM23549.1 hypothetical protein RBU61_11355 [Tissierella sp. MB52-C2]
MNKRYGNPPKKYYNKQVNRLIFVLVTLLIVLLIKMMNTKITNDIINIIERNVYYEFSLKEDGRKVKEYLGKVVDISMEAIDELTGQLNKRNK